MKKITIVCISTLMYTWLSGQIPFSTIKPATATETLTKDKAEEEIEKPDFFDHFNANIVTIQNGGKLFPAVNGEVVTYQLGIGKIKFYNNQDDKDNKTTANKEKKMMYLPLSIITNVSGDYLDPGAGTTADATSFFGAPLTFRLAPGFDLTPFWSDNKLFFGLNGDARLMAIGDTITNQVEAGFGAYGSAGFSYMGKGFVKEPTDDAKRYDGKWSFSVIFYTFKSGGKFNKAVFGDYEKKSLSGLEMMFRFKTNDNEHSKFNLLIGASNGFTRGAANFAKWQFRIGMGT